MYVCLGQGLGELLPKDSKYGTIGPRSLGLACRGAIRGSSSTGDVIPYHLDGMEVGRRGHI